LASGGSAFGAFFSFDEVGPVGGVSSPIGSTKGPLSVQPTTLKTEF
jgi:hypothetical protein